MDAAYEIEGETRGGAWVVTCDHASNHVPVSVAGGDLGVAAADMARHIAYDVGAEGVSRALARALDAPVICSRFSRLVIDPNRGEDDPTLVMRLYDGTIIPANRRVDFTELERRLTLFHRPYHHALEGLLATRPAAPIIAIHSYTPQLRGRPPRPWHVGVLYSGDARLALPLLEALARESDLCVGDNEPYSGHLPGDSMDRHGIVPGRPHILIEIRNDLIEAEADQAAWGRRLAPMVEEARREAGL